MDFTRIVQGIAQQIVFDTDTSSMIQRFQTLPFEYKEDMTREQLLDLFPDKNFIRNNTEILIVTNFAYKHSDGVIKVDKTTIDNSILAIHSKKLNAGIKPVMCKLFR